MATTEALIEYLLPVLAQAGRYACFIQSRIAHQPDKYDGVNPFAAALTDADLSVQGFVEVALLAKFPEVAFFGEEADSSLNMKYFPESAELKVFLDPIDGTRYYKDQDRRFNIIITICSPERIEGAIVYMPSFQTFYLAERGKGAYVRTVSDLEEGKKGSRLVLDTDGRRMITYNADGVISQLASTFDVVNIAADYRAESPCPSINGILTGEGVGIVGCGSHLIDWGGIALVACEAGAQASDFSGQEVLDSVASAPHTYAELLLTASADLHQQALEALAISS